MKICSKCKIEYPATDQYFIKDNRRYLGLGYYCRGCHRIYTNKYYQKNHKKSLEKARKYLKKNRDKVNGRHRQKRQDPEYRKREKEYRKKNKERYNFLCKRRIARKRGAGGSHTQEEWERLKKEYNYTCPMCGKKEPTIKLTEDHVIPITRWGKFMRGSQFNYHRCDDIENIQPLCLSCNSHKHTDTFRPDIKVMKTFEKLYCSEQVPQNIIREV